VPRSRASSARRAAGEVLVSESDRELVPGDVLELVDELLRRLQLEAANGRVELEFRDRRLTKLRRHEEFSRTDLGGGRREDG
jgi:hypothetical protein